MFDIGFWELVLIAVIGLVVLGPERLPVAVRTVARWVRTFRAMAASVQNELNQELKLQEMQENLKKAEQMNLKSLSPEIDASLNELKEAAASVQRPYAKNETTVATPPPASKPSTDAQATDESRQQPSAAELAELEEDDHPMLVAGLHEPLEHAEPVEHTPIKSPSPSSNATGHNDKGGV